MLMQILLSPHEIMKGCHSLLNNFEVSQRQSLLSTVMLFITVLVSIETVPPTKSLSNVSLQYQTLH